ncbi:TonB-dependent receptor domain-containing protein [Crenothrix polyspora]|uniref:Vitamin B12 transporter BtuB n=1 Tax=Crenothrix polyspora TaxID=360316 RepID=A0A1R4HG75_9GAMM|nr:TonB-dependent receptor [Crenothrix polyspora]SJM95224.1 Vitamin B12 transporter BtuB [Crenothrix polyspora]
MKKILYSSILLASVHTPLLHAQTPNDPTQAAVDLPEMVVSAMRSDTPKKQLSAASTVYTRNDIERLQVNTLPELLRGTTGLDMTQNGGLGKNTSVFMRGTNSDHVLVLIDGIKMGSATTGTSPFEFVPIDQVERVEIIRGPQSSLYGSEAIGGVIQIFTRKGGNSDKPQFSLNAGGGSYDTYRTAGNVSGKWKNSWYNLGASSLGTEGINARQPILGQFGFSQPDRDGYQNTAMNARAGHRFDNNAEVEASFIRAEGSTEYDSAFGGDHAEFITQTIGLSGSMDIADNWRSTLRLGQSRDESDTFLSDKNNTPDGRFNTTRWNASWLNQFDITDNHQLILGSDYRLDEVETGDLDKFNTGFDTYNELSRYDVGVFGEYQGQFFDKHFVNASVRWDKNEKSGNYVTGNVGIRSNWAYGLSTFANFGNAFKTPTFNQLFWPDTGFGGGNPNLQPEESTSVEVGLAGDHNLPGSNNTVEWELRAYHTDVDNLISGWPPKNVNKAQIDGIEAEIGTHILGWNTKLNMNLLSPRNRITDKRLDSRSEKSLSFDVSRSFQQVDIGVNVLAQGDRSATFTGRAAGYVTVDLRAAYHINKNWMLSAKLNNLLDKDYQTVNTYNTQGMNYFLSIHYNN